MSKRVVIGAVLLTMVVSFAGMSAGADNLVIDTLGAMPFLSGSSSYMPVQSVASFLGAQLVWDSAKGQAALAYNGKQLALTPGSRNALLDGQPVALSAAPMVVGGRLFLPTEVLRRTYGIPVEWDQANSQVRIKGPTGWGVATVGRRPPGWNRGRKTGWAKHGDVTMPPGLSKKQGSSSVIAVPSAGAKSHKTGKGGGVGSRRSSGPSGKGRARGR